MSVGDLKGGNLLRESYAGAKSTKRIRLPFYHCQGWCYSNLFGKMLPHYSYDILENKYVERLYSVVIIYNYIIFMIIIINTI